MKFLSEKKLRKIIRESLISELKLGIVRNFEWTDCTEVDLPSGYLGPTGDQALKSIEDASALAAQAYGVPGIACDIFNSIFGDNPEEATRKAKKVVTEIEDLNSSIFESEFDDLKSNPSKFVETMSSQTDSPEESHVTIDLADLEDTVRKIEEASEFSQDPGSLIIEVIEIIEINDKGSVKSVRNLDKNQSITKEALVTLIRDQSIKMCKAIAHRNLRQDPIMTLYKPYPEYQAFINYVRA